VPQVLLLLTWLAKDLCKPLEDFDLDLLMFEAVGPLFLG
jgi:hypothetical protein